MEAEILFTTSVIVHELTRRHTPGYLFLYQHEYEYLKSCSLFYQPSGNVTLIE